MSSGDFSCTINISSQTRRRLITSFLLEHTLNNSSAPNISSHPEHLKAIKGTKSSKEKSLSSIRVQTQIKSSIHWRSEFLLQLSLQLSANAKPDSDWFLLFLKPLPLFPYRLCGVMNSVSQTAVILTPSRPSSLPPHTLRTLISHNTSHEPSALTGSDTHHTGCRGWDVER